MNLMGTSIRPEISKSSDYYISKHRYYELKHFCMQYPEWSKRYNELLYIAKPLVYANYSTKFRTNVDHVADIAIRRKYYKDRMDMIDRTVSDVAPDIYAQLRSVIIGEKTYTQVSTLYDIPYSKSSFYETYRKFFKLLSERRN